MELTDDVCSEHVERLVLCESVCEPERRFLAHLCELDEEDFTQPVHRHLLGVLRSQVKSATFGGIAGLGPTLREAMKRDKMMAEAFVEELFAIRWIPPETMANFEALCRTLRTYRRKREAVERARSGASAIQVSPVSDVGASIATLSDALQSLSDDLAPLPSFSDVSEVAKTVLDEAEGRGCSRTVRLYTGLSAIDGATGGLTSGQFVLLGARPGCGKSSLAKTITARVLDDGYAVWYVSLEERREDLVRSFFSQRTGIPAIKQKTGNLLDLDRRLLRDAAASFQGWKLEICDDPRVTITQLVTRATAKREASALDLIVVDHLHILTLPKAETHERALAQATLELRALAKSLNVPLLLLVQLNRQLTQREDPIPRLGDLRGSGGLEENAENVFFLHRPGALDPNADPREAKLIIAKQRFGSVGSFPIDFDPQSTLFKDKR